MKNPMKTPFFYVNRVFIYFQTTRFALIKGLSWLRENIHLQGRPQT